MSRETRRGAGKIKAIFTLLVLAVLALAAIQVVPAYMDNYWVQDAMTSEARFAVAQRKAEDDIREAIWKVVKDREIKATPPIKREDIKVEYAGRSINLGLKYTVFVDLYVYKFSMNFNPSAGERPL